MKYTILLSVLYTIFFESIAAQAYLDSLYTLQKHTSMGNIMFIDNEEILMVSNVRDTNTFADGIQVSRFHLDGTLLVENYHFDWMNYAIFHTHTAIIHDSFLYVSTLSRHSTEPHALLQFNKNTGALLQKIPVPNNRYPGQRISMRNMSRIDSQYIIFTASVYNSVPLTETQLTIMNLEDHSMRFLHVEQHGYSQRINHVVHRDDVYYIAGLLQRGDANLPDFDARLTVVALNTDGTDRWRYISPKGRGAWPFDLLLDDDGNILVTHAFHYQYCIGSYCEPVCRAAISKFTPEGELIWERALGHDIYGTYYNFLRVMIPSTDGEGYIAVGSQSNFSIEDFLQWPTVDTIATGEYFQDDGIIVKVSHAGDSLWTRSYNKVNQVFSADVLQDIVYHPHGGYLLSGYAAEYIPGEPLARMWLLHVDEYGCAVPGCHEIVSTSDPEAQTPMLIYPNPGSTELYVYQGDDRAYHYRVSDVSGRTLVSFKGSRAGHTSIVDTAAWPPGYYVVSRIDDAGRILSQGWIKL